MTNSSSPETTTCYLVNQLLEIIEGHLALAALEGAPARGAKRTVQDADVDGINDVVIEVPPGFRRSETPLNLCQQPVDQLPWRAVCQQFGEVLLLFYGHRSEPRGFREQRYRLAVYHEHPTSIPR